MNQYTVLVTNDDGPRSPFLQPLIEAFLADSNFKDVRAVVPAEEHSWIAQAVSRFKPVFASPHNFGKARGFLVSGTPADCASLGIFNLYPDKPDVIVSGINVGTNASLPFFESSGTIGGARQGFLSGVKSIAFSAVVPDSIFDEWRWDNFHALAKYESYWRVHATVASRLVSSLLDLAVWDKVDLFSVNLPWEISLDTPVEFTSLARVSYRALYTTRKDGGYEHHFRGFDPAGLTDAANNRLKSDFEVLKTGTISISPISYYLEPQDTELLDILEKSKSHLLKT